MLIDRRIIHFVIRKNVFENRCFRTSISFIEMCQCLVNHHGKFRMCFRWIGHCRCKWMFEEEWISIKWIWEWEWCSFSFLSPFDRLEPHIGPSHLRRTGEDCSKFFHLNRIFLPQLTRWRNNSFSPSIPKTFLNRLNRNFIEVHREKSKNFRKYLDEQDQFSSIDAKKSSFWRIFRVHSTEIFSSMKRKIFRRSISSVDRRKDDERRGEFPSNVANPMNRIDRRWRRDLFFIVSPSMTNRTRFVDKWKLFLSFNTIAEKGEKRRFPMTIRSMKNCSSLCYVDADPMLNEELMIHCVWNLKWWRRRKQ